MNDLTDERINFETLLLILKNQSIWRIKIILLYRRIKDSFKGHFLFQSIKRASEKF